MTSVPLPAGAAPQPAPAKEFVLTERERQLINDLRRIDFWRAGKNRIVTAMWNGVRAVVFDGQQIT